MFFEKKFNKIKILILFVFSLIFNQYYANQGLFPGESLGHYDISFRLITGDIPLVDYWTVSGVFIDYVQSLFYFVFGDSIQVYILHASIFNSLITLLVFFLNTKIFNLDTNYSFFYSLLFVVLAYPVSGTLYIDVHATLLCFVSVIFFLFYFNNKKNLYLFLSLLFLSFSFFTKIVPAAYLSIVIFLLLLFKVFYEKSIITLKYFFIYSISIFFFYLVLIFILKIPFYNIVEQYFLFPTTIGAKRINLDIFKLDSLSVYKFIFIPLILLVYFFFKNIYSGLKKNYLKICNTVIICSLVIVLYLHQSLTRNQEFIYFLIPVVFSFLSVQFTLKDLSKNKLKNIFLILICAIVVIKYHVRLNENRRFHELENVDLSKGLPATYISKKFYGLKWITPDYNESPILEINKINKLISELKDENLNNSIVISNYSFLSIIMNKNLNAPARWFFDDGNVYPIDKKNKYFEKYKLFLKNLILKKDIKSIFIAFDVNENEIFRFLNKNCFVLKKDLMYLKKFNIVSNCDLT